MNIVGSTCLTNCVALLRNAVWTLLTHQSSHFLTVFSLFLSYAVKSQGSNCWSILSSPQVLQRSVCALGSHTLRPFVVDQFFRSHWYHGEAHSCHRWVIEWNPLISCSAEKTVCSFMFLFSLVRQTCIHCCGFGLKMVVKAVISVLHRFSEQICLTEFKRDHRKLGVWIRI